MNKPIFVLGVGAQKAGTTWLYEYIKSDSKSNMGMLKEYHIWDAVLKPELCSNYLSKNPNSDIAKFRLRHQMQFNLNAYENYFNSLINNEKLITGDITPSYSVLSMNDFLYIKERIVNAGFNIKVVYLMRDPVQRCWSAMKMEYGSLFQNNQNNLFRIYEEFEEIYKSNQYIARTRYDQTLAALEKVFDKDQLWIGVYENLFIKETINDLSEFLNIGFNPEFMENKFNITVSTGLDDETAINCRKFYEIVYDYCDNKIPITQSLWAR